VPWPAWADRFGVLAVQWQGSVIAKMLVDYTVNQAQVRSFCCIARITTCASRLAPRPLDRLSAT
jgi:hypothetical protein